MDTTHTSSARITGIYRYPVKGLTPEALPHAELKIGETLRSDRRYAIENGPSGFDPAAPKWLPKPHFLMLQRDEWLAPLRAHFDDDSHVVASPLLAPPTFHSSTCELPERDRSDTSFPPVPAFPIGPDPHACDCCLVDNT